MKGKNRSMGKRKIKLFNRLMEEVKSNVILVEGLKDKREFVGIGCKGRMVRTLAGHMKKTCERLKDEGVAKAIVLTDLDRKGNLLAERTIEELNAMGIAHTNLTVRKRLAWLLNLREWETLREKVGRFLEDLEP